MPVLVRPRQAVTDVLDVLSEVLAAASIATADAVTWTRGPVEKSQLHLVPNPNPNGDPRTTKTDRL